MSIQQMKPIMTFNVISDLHVTGWENKFNKHFEEALKDLNEVNPEAKALCIVGDMTESGRDENYERFQAILDAYPHPETYMVLGNHDVRWLEGGYEEAYNCFMKHTQMPHAYYDKWICGYHFIFLSTEEALKDEGRITKGQLTWLKDKLDEGADSKPVFVFLHQSLVETSAGSYEVDGYAHSGHPDGILEDRELRNILSEYPRVLFFTGHTHAVVDHPQTVIKKEGIYYINTASVAYTLQSDGYGEDNGSQGLCIDVYEDEVIIKGRDFMKKTWPMTWGIDLNEGIVLPR